MATARAVTPGTPIGLREASRKYRLDHSLLSRWARSGKVATVGDKLDEASLLAALAHYQPHKDNSLRHGHRNGKAITRPAPRSFIAGR